MTALYNEIDPFAAAWLRNLIAEGHIAPGDVCERDIRDLKPSDIAGYTQFHAFAGIGVWSYAARRAGWSDSRPLWTMSCPCQPFSAAGKGGGFDDERHLWPAAFHLVSQCRPAVVFGEQVASKDGYAWLDLVQADMEGVGYSLGPHVSPSAGFGAPHERHRIRFAAEGPVDHAADTRRHAAGQYERGPSLLAARSFESGGLSGLGDDDDARLQKQLRIGGISPAAHGTHQGEALERAGSPIGGLADDYRNEQRSGGDHRDSESQGLRANIDGRSDGCGLADADGRQRGWVADGEGRQPDGQATGRQQGHGEPERGRAAYGLADAGPERQQQHAQRVGESFTGREEGAFWNDVGGCGGLVRPLPTNGFWRDADWLFCRDGKWRPVEPGTFPLAHGAASRVGRLRAYGNAVDAEATEHFIRAYLEKDIVEIDAERLRLTGVYDDARDIGAFA